VLLHAGFTNGVVKIDYLKEVRDVPIDYVVKQVGVHMSGKK